jgi:hypothetical protein
MSVASAYVQSGKYKRVLLGADKMSSIVDYRSIYLVSFWRWRRCSIVEPNHEGLGLG